MADIFISYSHEDRPLAQELAANLNQAGYDVWWDNHLTIGHPFSSEILDFLSVARAVIVLWTPNSKVSEYVRNEAGIAWVRNSYLPFLSDGVEYAQLPGPLADIQSQRLRKTDELFAALAGKGVLPLSALEIGTRATLDIAGQGLWRAIRVFTAKCKARNITTPLTSAGTHAFQQTLGINTINYGTIDKNGRLALTEFKTRRAKDWPEIAQNYLDHLCDLVPEAEPYRVLGETPASWHVLSAAALMKNGDAWVRLINDTHAKLTEAARS